jgi:hypothetical protein
MSLCMTLSVLPVWSEPYLLVHLGGIFCNDCAAVTPIISNCLDPMGREDVAISA